MINGFEYISDENCTVLVLGTMPGAESLRKQQYYAYQWNQFWRIIFEIFDVEKTEDYEEKKRVLLRHHIALWDVLRNCEREDSSDNNIKIPMANDFDQLFQKLPKLRYICFNGKEAEKLFKRLVIKTIDADCYNYLVFPSTSPANTVKYEQKLGVWKKLSEICGNTL